MILPTNAQLSGQIRIVQKELFQNNLYILYIDVCSYIISLHRRKSISICFTTKCWIVNNRKINYKTSKMCTITQPIPTT